MSERKILGTNNYFTNMNLDRSYGFKEQYRTVKKGLGIECRDIGNDKQNFEIQVRQKMSEKGNSERKVLNNSKEGEIGQQAKIKGSQFQQLVQLREYYKKCLKSKKQLQKRCQQLQGQNRLLLISHKSIQQLKSQNNILKQELSHYKLQLFNTKDKLKMKHQQYMDNILIKRKQLQMTLEINQESNNMKVQRLEKQLQKMQLQNYHLHQQILSLKNQLKTIQIQKDQISILKENKTYNKNENNRVQKQYETKLRQQYESKLKRSLQSINQKYQLKLINLQSQLQMEKFKYLTVNQQYKHLQSKLSQLSEQLHKTKTQNHQYLQLNDELNKKCLDFSFLTKQIINKIQQLSQTQTQTILQYLQIVKDKLSRIQQGKNVTYLQSDTKNFLPINWRQQQSHFQTSTPFLDNLFSSLIKDTQQNSTIIQSLKHQQQNQQSTLQLPQKQKRFTFNPYESSEEQNYFQLKNQQHQERTIRKQREEQQFENKILRERNAIQARIRAKYQSQKKVFNQLSLGKENFTTMKQKQTNYDLRRLDFSLRNEGKQKAHYLTRQFSFQLQK